MDWLRSRTITPFAFAFVAVACLIALASCAEPLPGDPDPQDAGNGGSASAVQTIYAQTAIGLPGCSNIQAPTPQTSDLSANFQSNGSIRFIAPNGGGNGQSASAPASASQLSSLAQSASGPSIAFFFAPGTYTLNNSVDLNASGQVHLIGPCAQATTLDFQGSSGLSIQGASTASLVGLEIHAEASSAANPLVDIQQTDKLIVAGSYLTDPIGSTTGTGVRVSGSTSVGFARSVIDGFDTGVHLPDGADLSAMRTWWRDIGERGIHAENPSVGSGTWGSAVMLNYSAFHGNDPAGMTSSAEAAIEIQGGFLAARHTDISGLASTSMFDPSTVAAAGIHATDSLVRLTDGTELTANGQPGLFARDTRLVVDDTRITQNQRGVYATTDGTPGFPTSFYDSGGSGRNPLGAAPSNPFEKGLVLANDGFVPGGSLFPDEPQWFPDEPQWFPDEPQWFPDEPQWFPDEPQWAPNQPFFEGNMPAPSNATAADTWTTVGVGGNTSISQNITVGLQASGVLAYINGAQVGGTQPSPSMPGSLTVDPSRAGHGMALSTNGTAFLRNVTLQSNFGAGVIGEGVSSANTSGSVFALDRVTSLENGGPGALVLDGDDQDTLGVRDSSFLSNGAVGVGLRGIEANIQDSQISATRLADYGSGQSAISLGDGIHAIDSSLSAVRTNFARNARTGCFMVGGSLVTQNSTWNGNGGESRRPLTLHANTSVDIDSDLPRISCLESGLSEEECQGLGADSISFGLPGFLEE
jgi:hypothetical protein